MNVFETQTIKPLVEQELEVKIPLVDESTAVYLQKVIDYVANE